MSVGEKIKMIRKMRRLSQGELAERAGISQAMLCQVEREIKNPSLQVSYEIAKILGCKMEDFLRGE